jgi:hypothetical protein
MSGLENDDQVLKSLQLDHRISERARERANLFKTQKTSIYCSRVHGI